MGKSAVRAVPEPSVQNFEAMVLPHITTVRRVLAARVALGAYAAALL